MKGITREYLGEIDSVSEHAGAGTNLRKRKAAQRSAVADRQLPQAPKMEQGVVGCILLAPSECMDECQEAGLQPDWFYDLRHGTIYETAQQLHAASKPWDIIVLQQKLKDAGLLDQVGGVAYLAQLQDAVPSAANLSYYLEFVSEKCQLRNLIQTCHEMEARAYEHKGEVTELLDECERDFLKATQKATHSREIGIKALLNGRVIPKLDGHYTRGRAQMSGLVTTGLEYLDKIFCGLGGDNGNYHVIGARPNVGKTSLVTGMALHAALDFEWNEEVNEETWIAATAVGQPGFRTEEGRCFVERKGVPAGISSLEMSAESLGLKMLFQRARADLQRWRNGFATKADFQPLALAAAQMAKLDNIFIDDTPREDIHSIKAKWRRWHRQHGVRFFILDYIQLIKTSNKRFRQDRVQEMEEISAEIQALGKELNCPMVIIAQLNRDYEKEPTRLPRLSDLKNCGAIEQDADSVTLLYRPSIYKPFSKEYTTDYEFFKQCMEQKFGANWKKNDGRPERINALVEKNKHGPKGDAQLLFLKSSTLFLDYNVWLKENGFKDAAKGEEFRYKESKDAAETEEL